jgi:DNA-binding GntR family transcriptional regulator
LTIIVFWFNLNANAFKLRVAVQKQLLREDERCNSQDRAYTYCKSAILSLQLRPGQRLRAQELASQLGISRTPVREALSRLEQEGFVQREGGWGYVVKRMTFQEAMDFYKVREALEVERIREAVSNCTEEWSNRLSAVLNSASSALNNNKIADFRMHMREFRNLETLIASNTYLSAIFLSIDDRVELLSAMIFDLHADRSREVLLEVQAILQALTKRDNAAAEKAVRKHVSMSKESFIKYVLACSRSAPMNRTLNINMASVPGAVMT